MAFIVFKEISMNCFQRLQEYAKQTCKLTNSCKENAILKEGCKQQLDKDILEDLKKHLDKINRKKMKCVFFGQTSNGKSCMINAILGREVLPSSDGRTTSCFITIDGCDEDPYFEVDGYRENDIRKLTDKANEICDSHLSIKSHIELFWPIYECELLGENVQLLDSPGVDFSKDKDKWIETYCLDSDIFVYVVNAQATINESERGFFRKVTRFIKSPNIFVALNKWDLCETSKNATRIDRIKEQHYETVNEFLCRDLRLECDSRSKSFFLSAKEKLENLETRGLSDSNMIARIKEFDRFKQILFDEMSKNAIINKFSPHLDKALEYIDEMNVILKQFRSVTRQDMPMVTKERRQLIEEIENLIKDIFKKIITEGETEIRFQCPSFAQSIIASDGQELGIREFVHSKIIDKLQKILVENIKIIRSKMIDSFESCSEFKLSDTVLNGYLPPSFDEHVTGLQKGLANQLDRGNSEVQEHYHSKSKEMAEADGFENLLSGLGESGGYAAMFLMFTNPLYAAGTALVSGIIRTAMDGYKSNKRKEMIEEIRRNTENVLISLVKDCYQGTQIEIENSIKGYVDRFCDDHERARDLMIQISMLQSFCDEFIEDLTLERIKIMSLQ